MLQVEDQGKRAELAQVLGLTAEELQSTHDAAALATSASGSAAAPHDDDPIF